MKSLVCGLLVLVAGAVCAQDFPLRPVRFVVPYAPGAINDAVARMLAQRLTETWPHPVIVDNRGGGGSIIGTEIVARSPPDGHTMLLTSVAHAITPALHKKLPYDVMRDFAYVTRVGYGPFILAVHPGLAVNSVKGLVAAAKAKPGQISYGSSGIGGGAHLATEVFKSMAGIDLVHVPYKGGGPAIADLLAGQVQLTFATPIALGGHIKAGRLRALAVSSATRARPARSADHGRSLLSGLRRRARLGSRRARGHPQSGDRTHSCLGRHDPAPARSHRALCRAKRRDHRRDARRSDRTHAIGTRTLGQGSQGFGRKDRLKRCARGPCVGIESLVRGDPERRP